MNRDVPPAAMRVFVYEVVWGVVFLCFFKVVICKFGFLYTDDVWVF